jgi:redox-sensitive bicupin YhaK (pirin superfamily)
MTVEVLDARASDVGGMAVRRALPHRPRRSIGAWCLVDHYGPADVDGSPAMQLGPHPHIGLQTVTWLLAGEVIHTDGIGSEQPIRPGQLNLMTSGRGIAHAEQSPTDHGPLLHGLQLWVALPDADRHDAPAFEHHGELPHATGAGFDATVVVGSLGGAASPATVHTPIVGADIVLHGDRAEVPLDADHEHGVIVLDGSASFDGEHIEPGRLAYFEPGRSSVEIRADRPARAFLVGGEPFPETLSMWWNFVARDHAEIDEARAAWNNRTGHFADVHSDLPVIEAPATPWRPSTA